MLAVDASQGSQEMPSSGSHMRDGEKNRVNGAGAVQSAAEHKARLLDSLPDCIFLVDPDQRVLAANSTALTTLDLDSEQVVGHSLAGGLSRLTDNEGRQFDMDQPVERVFTNGEAELLDAWLECDISGLPGSESELRKVSVAVLPIADRDESSVAVVISGEAIRQPYGLRDAVLSMVSHELRTPLLHIKGFVSTLLESDIDWDEETRLDFLRTIDREADRLTSMVSDLMEITRMGSADLPLHREYADPYLLAYGAIDSASPFIRKHRVVVDVPEDLPKVHIDVLRVTGVLVNLLENASKYSEPGSRIVIDAASDGSQVTFSVADQGAGIAEEAHSKVFSMFYRGGHQGERSNGTGLGLAVCKSVVDAHRGKIWVESESGSGATFYFTIPLEPNSPRVKQGSRRRRRAGSTSRISENRPRDRDDNEDEGVGPAGPKNRMRERLKV